MADNDTLTYHVRRSPKNQAQSADQSLITQERNQKLDLLMHLLANLTQPLVVSGPEGIGKSTFLRVLLGRHVSTWIYCLVQANEDLSFEKILEQITSVLSRDKSKSDIALTATLGQFENQNKKIIVLIDDAGDLVPGLITSLIQYAANHPALRLVFVVTPDDLYVKNRTDRVIDDCHFVEIPPLSEKQCGEFLKHLAAKPIPQIAFNSINESLVEKVYRKTHGIPGRIIADLPTAANPKLGRNPTVILILAVLTLVAIALGMQWYSAKNNTDLKKQPIEKQKQVVSKITPASSQTLETKPILLNEQLGEKNNFELFPGQQQGNKTAPNPTNTDLVKQSPVNLVSGVSAPTSSETKSENNLPTDSNKLASPAMNQSVVSPMPVPEANEKTQQNVIEPTDSKDKENSDRGGSGWIMTQPPNNYTLQMMVLTREDAVKNIVNSYRSLGQGLTYVRKKSPKGRGKFLLLYGSFASVESAYKVRQKLPADFRQSIARKISAIKSEME